jgi:hypothetical protein
MSKLWAPNPIGAIAVIARPRRSQGVHALKRPDLAETVRIGDFLSALIGLTRAFSRKRSCLPN